MNINAVLCKLVQSLNVNKLSLNIEKTHYMIFIVAFLQNATIEYSSESVCVCVCVLA